MTRAALLGGSGFIGRWLCRELASRGWEAVALDRRPCLEPGVRFEQVELEDAEAVARHLRPGDIVFHLYHSSIPADSLDNPEAERKKNVLPYARLLERLNEAGASMIVYSSTGGQIYGHAERLPIPESAKPRPITPYGRAKLEMERLTREAGLPHLILRIGNPYGPHQEQTNRHGAIPALFRAAITGEPFVAFGGGSAVRDYLYIEDAASVVFRLLERGVQNETLNIGSGQGVSLSELIAKAEQASGARIKLVPAPLRDSDVRENVLDISRLQALTGFSPAISLEQGLEITWRHLKQKRGAR